MKNSFVMYTSYQEHISLLSMEQRGVLLTAIMNHAGGQELPEMDSMVQMAFSFIRSDLDRNTEKYERICEARREAGKKGGRPKAKKANGFFEKQIKAKKPDNEDDDEDDLKENTPKGVQKKFKPPTLDEVKQFIAERKSSVDAEQFVDFYSSKGWMIGKNKMQDWKAAIRTWERNQRQGMTANGESKRLEKTAERKPAGRFDNFQSRNYDYAEIERQLLRGGG